MPNDEDFVPLPTEEHFTEKLKTASLYYSETIKPDENQKTLAQRIPKDVAAQYNIFPVDEKANVLILATGQKQTIKEQKIIETILERKVKLLLADAVNVDKAISEFYDLNLTGFRQSQAKNNTDEVTSILKNNVIRMIHEAAAKDASDIHILPYEEGVYIHFRILGHLVEVTDEYNILPEEANQLVNIIKNMDTSGQANASNVNMPGQGQFSIMYNDIKYNIRISTVPIALDKQSVVLRLLPQIRKRKKLDDLGYQQDEINIIKEVLLKTSSGMMITSGPVGQGKTTFLYAQLHEDIEMRGEPQSVYTIENPVEIREPSFCQVQVHVAKDEDLSLTEPLALSTGLRHDPDKFLYGEIRTKKDAEVAIEGAQTGHKVFATIHAKNCVATISRLLGLGANRSALLSEVNFIMNQRLVSLLCPKCKKRHLLTEREKAILSESELEILKGKALFAKGDIENVRNCTCDGGYISRRPIMEYVIFDTELRDTFLDPNIRFSAIEEILKKKKFRSMWEKGMELVVAGETGLVEILQTIGKE
jgi:type IV pilus assembly protein PilB